MPAQVGVEDDRDARRRAQRRGAASVTERSVSLTSVFEPKTSALAAGDGLGRPLADRREARLDPVAVDDVGGLARRGRR